MKGKFLFFLRADSGQHFLPEVKSSNIFCELGLQVRELYALLRRCPASPIIPNGLVQMQLSNILIKYPNLQTSNNGAIGEENILTNSSGATSTNLSKIADKKGQFC